MRICGRDVANNSHRPMRPSDVSALREKGNKMAIRSKFMLLQALSLKTRQVNALAKSAIKYICFGD